MEEAIGFDISTENADRIRDLSASDMARLAAAVHEHTHSEYHRIPVFDVDVVGVSHVESPVGQILGGPTPDGHIGRDIDELVGAVYQSLMMQDRLMLPDGLQYALDYYTFGLPDDSIHAVQGPQIVKILTAYATLRPLFVNRTLMIFPMDAWPMSTATMHEELVIELAGSAFIKKLLKKYPKSDAYIEWRLKSDKRLNNNYIISDTEKYTRILVARDVLSWDRGKVRSLAAISSRYGLVPILQGPLMQNIFDAIVRSGSADRREPLVHAVEDSILLPYLGRLPVSEFAALKTAGDLRAVGKTLRTIDNVGATVLDRPYELRELLKDELRSAADEIGSIVNSSTVLKRSVTSARSVCLGALMVPAAAMLAGYPADPFKTLVLSGAGAAAGLANTILDDVVAANQKRPIRRLYLKLASEIESDQVGATL